MEDLAQRAGAALDVPPDRILAELRQARGTRIDRDGGRRRYTACAIPSGQQAVRDAGSACRKPIDFDAVDGKPVDTVFLLLLPDAPAANGSARWPASRANCGIRRPSPRCGVRATGRKFTARCCRLTANGSSATIAAPQPRPIVTGKRPTKGGDRWPMNSFSTPIRGRAAVSCAGCSRKSASPIATEVLDYGTTMKAPAYLAINPMGKVPALRMATWL